VLSAVQRRAKAFVEWQHLSSDLIRGVAYGLTVLKPHEVRHFHDGDQCSSTWWKAKQEAKRKKGDEAKEKSPGG
jgi:hypothetical protein